MWKLMKYEMRKTWMTKVILLLITAVAEIGFLIGLYAEKEGTLAASVFILMMLAFGGVLVMGLESILTLHRDMNTRQSYMLFMTPNSCYKILGAKVLECGASILLAGAFYFALGALDVTLILAKSGELDKVWKMLQELLTNFTVEGRPIQIDIRTAGAISCMLLSSWMATITTAYLADVISAALLNGRKYNGLISFLLFLALNMIVSRVTQLITRGIPDTMTMLFVYSGIALVFSAAMYIATAVIMEKKLSV